MTITQFNAKPLLLVGFSSDINKPKDFLFYFNEVLKILSVQIHCTEHKAAKTIT